MIFSKIILIIVCMMSLIGYESDCEKYQKLEINDVASVKKSDLPDEFNDIAFEVVDEFIKKTMNLDYEILLLFDYNTGEILKCKIGNENDVKLQFKDYDFEDKHVASIHNHTKDMYSPPSYKNFGIFQRKWEEYELIAANKCLWILKGKLKDEKLSEELRKESYKLFISSFHYYKIKCKSEDMIFRKCDELYGKRLSNYINNKNIKDIQLIKKEYGHD